MIKFPWTFSSSGTERSVTRVEAFSDGVFAIAITLLILEIKVPAISESSNISSLFKHLINLWPSYFAYLLSFVAIGIYWANHHYMFKLFKRTNHSVNLLNLLLLMAVSFLPFPTAVLAKYMLIPSEQASATIFYAIGLMLPATAWFLLWFYSSSKKDIIDPDLSKEFIRELTTQYGLSVFVYVAAIAAALVSFQLGLAFCTGLTMLYLLPPKSPVYTVVSSTNDN